MINQAMVNSKIIQFIETSSTIINPVKLSSTIINPVKLSSTTFNHLHPFPRQAFLEVERITLNFV